MTAKHVANKVNCKRKKSFSEGNSKLLNKNSDESSSHTAAELVTKREEYSYYRSHIVPLLNTVMKVLYVP